ncbi:hypothetical protein VKT23_015633 [Stygiomarasmius scandens]|uniref:Uncharacterized protein n=1 Tax=Marasmiellus scandens TaxID=2682957 RepID=A0ABR1IWT1_9AGAR
MIQSSEERTHKFSLGNLLQEAPNLRGGSTILQQVSILAKTSDSFQAGSFHASLPIPHVNAYEDQDVDTLPSLRSLEVKFAVYTNQQVSTHISEKEVGNLFQYLNTPSLTDLSVQVTYYGHSNVMNIMTLMPFDSLPERSLYSLHSL